MLIHQSAFYVYLPYFHELHVHKMNDYILEFSSNDIELIVYVYAFLVPGKG